MMYGAGINGLGCATEGGGLFGSGWMVTGMMGFGLVFTVLLIAAIVWLLTSQKERVQHMAGPLAGYGYVAPTQPTHVATHSTIPGADHALEIARSRFARGEIDREEFDRLLAALQR